ncbi:MAG: S-methyl-5-thioribose-1-phosphate isomerase [Planctomycetota bacterium]
MRRRRWLLRGAAAAEMVSRMSFPETNAPNENPDVPGLPLTIGWTGELPGVCTLVDQTLLPGATEFLQRTDVADLIADIKRLAVRGAPAIGVAGAYAVVLAAQTRLKSSAAEVRAAVREWAPAIADARPTAVNLGWAVNRMLDHMAEDAGETGEQACRRLLDEAIAIHRSDMETCRAIGRNGAALVPAGGQVVTHCNAGALATGGQGTALSVLFEAHKNGTEFSVLADETRPLLQGARITAFELACAGIPVRVCCDGASASAMRTGQAQMVVVGADRIAANGDAANKIGTYPLACAARAAGIPFYVAAPLSTFDLSLASGDLIPIEQRAREEVATNGRGGMPEGVEAWNPAFDVTPAELITGIITERGVIESPDTAKVAAHCA